MSFPFAYLGMLNKSIFNTRATSILLALATCTLVLLALQLQLRSRDTVLHLQKTAQTNVRMQTAFTENAAEPSGDLSLELTGQLHHKAYSSHNT